MPEQGLPINPLKKRFNELFAATPAIWNVLQGDKIFDKLVPPTTDGSTLRPMPYFAWGNPTDSPHADQSSAFGQAGSASTLTLFIYSNRKFSDSEVMDLADKVIRLLSGKKHTLEGFQTATCTVFLNGSFSVPTGQQAMLTISTTTRTIPT